MFRKSMFYIALILCLVPFISYGQDSLNVSKISQMYDFWNGAEDMAVNGNFAYIADGTMGIRVVDISTPASPTEIYHLFLPGYCSMVVTEGDYIYTASHDSLVRIIDVADPSAPVILGSYLVPYRYFDIDVSAGFVYVVTWNEDFIIIDVSDPENPYQAAYIGLDYDGECLDVSGGYAYVMGSFGLKIFDVSNPFLPVEVGSSYPYWYGFDIVVKNGIAYVAGDVFFTIDVSDPQNPISAGECWTTTYPMRLGVNGNYAYISGTNWCSTWIAGMSIVDASDPYLPVEVNFFNNLCFGGCAFIDNCLYLTLAYTGFQVFDISEPENPEIISSCLNRGQIYDVAISGDFAYLADCYNGIRIVNISDQNNPFETTLFELSGYVRTVAIGGEYLYVGYSDSLLSIIDISNPYLPTEIGMFETENYIEDIAVSGNYVFLAANYDGLIILDVSDPSLPVEIGSFTGVNAHHIAVNNVYAYLASSGGNFRLKVLDISDPANPQFLGELSYHINGLAVSGDYVYAASGDTKELLIINVAYPLNPYIESSITLSGYTNDVAYQWGYAYVSQGFSGLSVVDVRDASNPVETGYYNSYGYAYAIAVNNERAFLADKNFFGIYDCSEAVSVDEQETETSPATFTLSPIHPNPFNQSAAISYKLQAAGQVNLSVYDITGREVASLVTGHSSLGEHSVVWDAEGLASGMYFVRLSQGDAVEVRKAVLLK